MEKETINVIIPQTPPELKSPLPKSCKPKDEHSPIRSIIPGTLPKVIAAGI